MSYLICEKHNKYEKGGSKAVTNTLICLCRTCPHSFKVMCNTCQQEHQAHADHLLSIEDVSFLVQRMNKAPAKDVGRAMSQTLEVLRKLKLIKEFRRRIDELEKEIQQESVKLVEQMEIVTREFNYGRDGVNRLSSLFQTIENIDTYNDFLENSVELLGCLDYNAKRDKFEYGSGRVKESEELRRLYMQTAKQKMLQVRDYSMKIIEVTLNHDDSDDEEVEGKMRQFMQMKEELCNDEQEGDEYVSDLKESTSTANKSQMKRESTDGFGQTELQVYTFHEMKELIEKKMQEMKVVHQSQQHMLHEKMQVMARQQQQLDNNLKTLRAKYEDKCKKTLHFTQQLLLNRKQREEKLKMQQSLASNIIEYSQSKQCPYQQRE